MTTTVKARTARKSHLCDSCHWTPSLRGVATILPGHRYLIHVAFPEGPMGEVNQSDRPYTLNECVACAEGRQSTAGTRRAGACAVFCCHGEIPCARPFGHTGNHSCHRCAQPAGRIPAAVAS